MLSNISQPDETVRARFPPSTMPNRRQFCGSRRLDRSSRPCRRPATNRRHHAAMKSLVLAAALAAVAVPAIAQPAPRKPTTAPPDVPDCAAMGVLPAAWDGQAYAIDGATLAGV